MSLQSPLLCDPADKAPIEARNGVEQIDYLTYLVGDLKITDLRESYLQQIHAIAVRDVYPCGGEYRNALRRVRIEGSSHQVPHESSVGLLVRDLLDGLNARRSEAPALERAAYALWRLCWIHPFAGGNGRSARALCYLIISMDLGQVPPGVPQMPTLIYERRSDYVNALRAADAGVLANGTPDLQPMKNLVEDVITHQLASAIERLGIPKTAPQ